MRARGRPRGGAQDTRTAILASAREAFAERGFERATLRHVAALAGVDPALIVYYFGTKEALLEAALEFPADPVALLRGVGEHGAAAGPEVVRRFLALWDDHPEARSRMQVVVRTAMTHEQAAGLVRVVLGRAIPRALGPAMASDQRPLRAGLVGSHLGGLMMGRYLIKIPALAGAEPEALVGAVGPVVQHYLTGHLAPARRR